jgi:hypothetical protein
MSERTTKQAAAGDWLLIDGLAHLFLNPGPHPVCDTPVSDAKFVLLEQGDPVCPDCDAYLRDVWLPQVS